MEEDELLAYDPFRRKIYCNVMSEVRQQKKNSPSRKRLSMSALGPNVDSKKVKQDNSKPATTIHSTPTLINTKNRTSNPVATITTDDLVHQVHDQLQSEWVCDINAEEESAKKRRHRMVHKASGRMRQDNQAKRMKMMYTKNL
jgi:hypothetical protein